MCIQHARVHLAVLEDMLGVPVIDVPSRFYLHRRPRCTRSKYACGLKNPTDSQEKDSESI